MAYSSVLPKDGTRWALLTVMLVELREGDVGCVIVAAASGIPKRAMVALPELTFVSRLSCIESRQKSANWYD